MRICAIGNSHLAMLKGGWDAIRREYPDTEITFFAAKVPLMPALKVQDGKLVFAGEDLRHAMMLTSNGIDHIAADYNAYLVVGCDISMRTLVHAAQEAEPADIETLNAIAVLERTRGILVARQLRQITTAPVVVMPAPYHAGAGAAGAYGWEHGLRTMKTLNGLYIAALDALSCAVDFTFYPQPPETIRPVEFLTVEKFSHGSVRYDGHGKHGSGDGKHMNAEFGALYLRSVLNTLKTSISGIR